MWGLLEEAFVTNIEMSLPLKVQLEWVRTEQ